MKPARHLEDFGKPAAPACDPDPTPSPEATALRESYEAGYAAGQKSGVVTAEESRAKEIAELVTVLQDGGFSYVEARQHVMNSLRSLIDVILDTMLPDLAEATLSQHAIDEVMTVADQVDAPIELMCPDHLVAEIKAIATAQTAVPLNVRGMADMTSSQIELRYNQGTTRVDLDGTIDRIRQITADFFTTTQQESVKNG